MRKEELPKYKIFRKGEQLSPKDLENIYTLLNDKGIKLSLTMDDLEFYKCFHSDPKVTYDSSNDFVCVHKTDYLPRNGMIYNTSNSTMKTNSVQILDKKYEYQYVDSPRDTIHFALNGEVGDHPYGNWSDKKYAYLIPFSDLPRDKLDNFNPVDTWYNGNIVLPPTTIFLCPEEEKQEIQKENPHLKIIGYSGKENVSGFANILVFSIGYNTEKCAMWAWINDKSQQKALDFAAREELQVNAHMCSDAVENEYARLQIKKFLPVIEILKNNNLVNTNNINQIKQQLLDQNLIDINMEQQLFKYLAGEGLVDASILKDNVSEISDCNNKSQYEDVLFSSVLETIVNGSNINKSVNKSL